MEEQKEEVALAKAAEAPKEGAAEGKAEAAPREVKQVPEVAVAAKMLATAEGLNEEAEEAKTEASAPPVRGAEAGKESKLEEAAETRKK